MKTGCYYFKQDNFNKVYIADKDCNEKVFDHDYEYFNEIVYWYIKNGDLKEINNIGEIGEGNFIFLIDHDNNVIKDNTNAYFFIMLDDAYMDANSDDWILKCW